MISAPLIWSFLSVLFSPLRISIWFCSSVIFCSCCGLVDLFLMDLCEYMTAPATDAMAIRDASRVLCGIFMVLLLSGYEDVIGFETCDSFESFDHEV